MLRRLGALAVLLAAGDARALEPPVLVIDNAGEERLRLRVEIGSYATCGVTSGKVFEGFVEPGKAVLIESGAPLLCISHGTKLSYGNALVVRPIASRSIRLSLPSPASSVVSPVAPLVVEPTRRMGLRLRAPTCDAAPFFTGIVDPNEPVAIPTDATCVCLEHSSKSGWTAPALRCRMPKCKKQNSPSSCVFDLEASFRIAP